MFCEGRSKSNGGGEEDNSTRDALKLGPNLGHPRTVKQQLCPQNKTAASAYIHHFLVENEIKKPQRLDFFLWRVSLQLLVSVLALIPWMDSVLSPVRLVHSVLVLFCTLIITLGKCKKDISFHGAPWSVFVISIRFQKGFIQRLVHSTEAVFLFRDCGSFNALHSD